MHTENKNTAAKTLQAAKNVGKLKKKVKQYDTIKQNVDNILRKGKMYVYKAQKFHAQNGVVRTLAISNKVQMTI